ncbi:Redoxin [alpha proteobacterium HIMB5]|nr:Redoxin [alpha proteobacterium HIMB5]
MKNKIVPFLVFLFFIFIFFVFYKSLNQTNIYTPNVNLNKNIPEFEAKILKSNESFSNKDFMLNEYYLINIWASWCAPCRLEHKYLLELNDINSLKMIGINYKDLKLNAENFLNDLGNPYDLILSDDNGKLSINWGAYGVPETFIVFNNKIVKKYTGPLNETNVQEIRKILSQ